jgi:hypothetical protein
MRVRGARSCWAPLTPRWLRWAGVEEAAESVRFRTQWEELMRRTMRLQEAMKGLALQLVLPSRQVVVPSTAPLAGRA